MKAPASASSRSTRFSRGTSAVPVKSTATSPPPGAYWSTKAVQRGEHDRRVLLARGQVAEQEHREVDREAIGVREGLLAHDGLGVARGLQRDEVERVGGAALQALAEGR